MFQVDILSDSQPYYRVIAGVISKNLWFGWQFDNLSRINQPCTVSNYEGGLAMQLWMVR
jgi:hypothetical protein